jgi:hypothetical protein
MASIHFSTFAAVGRFYPEREIIASRRLARIVRRAMGRRLRTSYSRLLECSWLRRMLPFECEMRFGDANFGYRGIDTSLLFRAPATFRFH